MRSWLGTGRWNQFPSDNPLKRRAEALDFVQQQRSPAMTLSQVPTTAEAQPDISYHPDETKWRARTARRLAENPALPSQPLPEGFPAKLEGPIVWKGSDFTSEDQWVVRLTDVHLQEIDDGLRHFKSELSSGSFLQRVTNILCRFEQTFGTYQPRNVPSSYTWCCPFRPRQGVVFRKGFLCLENHSRGEI